MQKYLKPVGFILFGFSMALIGFAASSYMVVYMEMNDRLKYEATYAKGYYSIVKHLNSGEVEKAKSNADFLIDAHFLTLSDYTYLQSSFLVSDIKDNLCEVAKYKLSGNIELKNEQAEQRIIDFAQEIADAC